MAFDSSKLSSNCAMFARTATSTDLLTANADVDSAKALPGKPGDFVLSSPDTTSCPNYDLTPGTCSSNPALKPDHPTGYRYTSQCKNTYKPGAGAIVSTLTVNTFAQCLDACDVSLVYIGRLIVEEG